MAALDKAIVTNSVALRAKYGEGFDVAAALAPLVVADAGRGLQARLIDLADAATMEELAGAPVTDPADQAQAKAAIDAVFAALRPDYLLILGSIDVVPHQALRNPTPDDHDADVPGDLPYACEAPYSADPADFRAPTRVVGRLPDAEHATDPALLSTVIAHAAGWQPRPPEDYRDYLGMSAQVWEDSTALSLRNAFGSSADLQLVPTAGPEWESALLARRSHFINCHGGSHDAHFYGQQGSSYPISHDAYYLDGKVPADAVVAAECCYGGQLYEALAARGHAGICVTYLAGGAHGFLGSSTIAYGPASGNGSADLICQYFFQRVLAGASLGRALLEARQQFVRNTNVLDPADQKTLAQFSLLGDPSIQPVAPPSAAATHAALGVERAPGGARAARRANLLAGGLALADARSYATPREAAPAPPAIAELAERLGMSEAMVSSYDVVPAPALGRMRGLAPSTPQAIHLLHAPLAGDAPAPQFRLVIATESGGQVTGVRDLYSR